MNRWPRPDEALASRLRGMQDSIRGAVNGLRDLRASHKALADRVERLERRMDEREEGEG